MNADTTRYHIVSGRWAGDMDPSLPVTVTEFYECCDALDWPRPELTPNRPGEAEYRDAATGEVVLRVADGR